MQHHDVSQPNTILLWYVAQKVILCVWEEEGKFGLHQS
jgi:hypothetical protein